MPLRESPVAAAFLSSLLLVHPAFAIAGDRSGLADAPDPANELAPTAPSAGPTLEMRRLHVAAGLVRIGRPRAEAFAAAARLTAEDIDVLSANPAMMQAAGDNSAYVIGIIGAVVVIGGIIALAIASDGGTITVN